MGYVVFHSISITGRYKHIFDFLIMHILLLIFVFSENNTVGSIVIWERQILPSKERNVLQRPTRVIFLWFYST
jgi:hypothetical protein